MKAYVVMADNAAYSLPLHWTEAINKLRASLASSPQMEPHVPGMGGGGHARVEILKRKIFLTPLRNESHYFSVAKPVT